MRRFCNIIKNEAVIRRNYLSCFKQTPLLPASSSLVDLGAKIDFRDISAALFYLFLLAKPFYLLPSGSFQIADGCLMLAFVSLIFSYRGSFEIVKTDLFFVCFVVCAGIVNSLYGLCYQSISFFTYTLYYIFNIASVLTFRSLATRDEFVANCAIMLRLGLLIQLIVFAAGEGRYFDDTRYMGTFNDPNQMGFFVFSSILFLHISARKHMAKRSLADDLIAIFLVLQTSSTNMIVGLCVLYLICVVVKCSESDIWRKITACCAVFFLAFALIAAPLSLKDDAKIVSSDSQISNAIGRITEKLEKVIDPKGSGYDSSILIDRGADKLMIYPEKILYGAGEGFWDRFELAYATNEIHSTVLGILFYYGVGPFVLLAIWVILNLRQCSFRSRTLLFYLPLLFECFFLANQRQPLLWMLIVLASVSPSSKERNVGQG